MSLECKVGTCNIPAALMILPLCLWNSTGTELCGWQEATKLLEGSLGSNRVAIINCIIIRVLTLAKIGRSTFALQFCSSTVASDSAQLFVASLLFVFYLLLFVSCQLFCIHIHSFCSVISNLFLFSVRSVLSVSSDYSIFSYSGLFLS